MSHGPVHSVSYVPFLAWQLTSTNASDPRVYKMEGTLCFMTVSEVTLPHFYDILLAVYSTIFNVGGDYTS